MNNVRDALLETLGLLVSRPMQILGAVLIIVVWPLTYLAQAIGHSL